MICPILSQRYVYAGLQKEKESNYSSGPDCVRGVKP